MSALVWIAVGAVIGVATVLILAGRRLRGARPRSGPAGNGGASPIPNGAMMRGAGDPVRVRLAAEDLQLICKRIEDLHVVRADVHRIGNLLERLLEEMTTLQGTRENPPPPVGEPVRFREPFRDASPEPSPILGAPRGQAGRDAGLRVQDDSHGGGFDPNLPPRPAPGDPTPAAVQLREPPPDAVHVEASNDIVVTSDRHPPEAWMERRGGEGEVWLNPRVTLTDPALQRWSTFFTWERREPGARYEATRPAVVTSAGSVVSKGVARPL